MFFEIIAFEVNFVCLNDCSCVFLVVMMGLTVLCCFCGYLTLCYGDDR